MDQVLREAQSDEIDDDSNQGPRLTIEEGFRKWSSRFETTKQAQKFKPFLAANYPTLSLKGELIRCLSYIAGRANDLYLLRRLNRHEGLWDSNDVVSMHEMLLFGEADDSGVSGMGRSCLSWCSWISSRASKSPGVPGA